MKRTRLSIIDSSTKLSRAAVRLKKQQPLPCKRCGSLPTIRRVDVHFAKDNSYLFTEVQIRCPSKACHTHGHYSPRATEREAIAAWNRRHNPKVS